ncbi:MAG: HAD-IB family hydrolase [Pseudomonadota bacterium]
MREAAFFDLDHTLVIGDSTERIFLRHLRRGGEVGTREILRWLAHFLREPTIAGGFFRCNKHYLAGKPLTRIQTLAAEAAAEAEALVSPRGRRCMEEHQRAGRLICLITGALDVVTEPLSRSLPVDVVMATTLASEDGRLTGRLNGLYPRGENKKVLMNRLAAQEGISLAGSYAYGDDFYDLPMLEAVGHPVAVNPRRGLEKVANARGWRIESF